MKNWKNGFAAVIFCTLISFSCTSQPAVSGLLSLDEAIEAAAVAIEGRVARGSEIAVYKITASHDAIGDYLAESLNDRISTRGNLVPLAREAALQYVDAEQQVQMSGMVSDASAVGIGRYLGAKVVITGTFDRYADFSQLRFRAVDVETSALLYSYTARINNGDRILANITAPFGRTQAPRITENALEHLNRARDLIAEGNWDEAMPEFDKAIAINKDLAEAYYYRGNAYYFEKDHDRAIADYTSAIRLDSNYADAYARRAQAYSWKSDYDRAIADCTQAIRLDPSAWQYTDRGYMYFYKGDYDRAMADYTSAIRIDPNYAYAYTSRGNVYYEKGDYDRAIADYTSAIRLEPNDAYWYKVRGDAYYNMGDYDRAITDYTQAIRLEPNDAYYRYYDRGYAYYNMGDYDRAIADYTQAIRLEPNEARSYHVRGDAYYMKRDYNRAIADYEAALRIDPNYDPARHNLELARQARGR